MKPNFNFVSAKEDVEIEEDIREVKKFKDLKISQTFQTESELIEVKTEAFHLNNNEDIKFLNEKNIEFNKVKSENCIISDISTQSPTEEKTSKRTQTNLKDLENQSLKRIAPTRNFSSNVLQTSCLITKRNPKNLKNKKLKSAGSKLKTQFVPKLKKSKYNFDLNKVIEEFFATPMDNYDEKEAQRILDEERAVRRKRFVQHHKWLRDDDEWEKEVDKVLAPFDITTYFSKYKPSSSEEFKANSSEEFKASSSEEFKASSSKSLESCSPRKPEPCSSEEFQSGTTKKFKPSFSIKPKPNTSKEPEPCSSKEFKPSSSNEPKLHTSKESESSSSMEFESSSTMETESSSSMEFEFSSTTEPGPSSSMEFESYSSMEPKPGCSKDYF